MPKKYYWKVVHKTNAKDEFTSLFVTQGKFCLKYKVGEIARSSIPETGVLVFRTRKQARCYKSNNGSESILKVSPQGKVIKNPVRYNWIELSECGKKVLSAIKDFPPGTVGLEAVKVIERVW